MRSVGTGQMNPAAFSEMEAAAKEKPLNRRCVIRRFRGIFFIEIGRMERKGVNQLRHG